MQHIGSQVIATKRFVLRPLRLSDAPWMFANWCSDDEVAKYMTWQAHKSQDTTRVLLEYWVGQQRRNDFYQWCIVHANTLEPIGMIDVVRIQEALGIGTVGYCLSRRYWGQGIMTEALILVEQYLFERVGFARLEAQHHLQNPASGRVMQKAGMQYEGIRRHGARDNQGRLCDIACYAILREDWLRLRAPHPHPEGA